MSQQSAKPTFGDLVLSVLPWPFHRDLPDGSRPKYAAWTIPIVILVALVFLLMLLGPWDEEVVTLNNGTGMYEARIGCRRQSWGGAEGYDVLLTLCSLKPERRFILRASIDTVDIPADATETYGASSWDSAGKELRDAGGNAILRIAGDGITVLRGKPPE